jgi:CRISPR-associated protein Cmr5
MGDKTLEQRRAGDALKCVEGVGSQKKMAGRYRSYAERLPAHIVMGGLGQALATELAAAGPPGAKRDDGEHAHAKLAEDLESWLGATAYRHVAEKERRESGWLLKAIMGGDQEHYLRAQAEALAWLVWLKKLCQASLPKVAEE